MKIEYVLKEDVETHLPDGTKVVLRFEKDGPGLVVKYAKIIGGTKKEDKLFTHLFDPMTSPVILRWMADQIEDVREKFARAQNTIDALEE